MTAAAHPDILTPNQVAELYGVGAKTVTRWAKAGLLPCFTTLGGHRRYRRADIERLLAGSAR